MPAIKRKPGLANPSLNECFSRAPGWNPVKHRLFGPISIHWASEPLCTLEIMSALVHGAVTEKGLQAKAFRIDQVFEKGIKVPEEIFLAINIQPHEICPWWDYTIRPIKACT